MKKDSYVECNCYHKFFKTIASKPRWRILEALANGPRTVSEIYSALNEEQSKVSHDLSKLASCNVITVEKIGKHRHYSLNKSTVLPLIRLIHSHVASCCGKECGVLK